MTSGGGHSTAAGACAWPAASRRQLLQRGGQAIRRRRRCAVADDLAVHRGHSRGAGGGHGALGRRPRRPAGRVAPRYWLAAAAVGTGGFGLSFLLYNTVISAVDAGGAAIVLNLIPAFGLASSVIFLREDPARTSVIGACLIGGSVACFAVCDSRDSHTSQPAADGPAATAR